MQTVYFLDIDDCLIETSRLGKAELTTLAAALKDLRIEKSSEIVADFEKSFHLLYDAHQGKKLDKKASIDLELYMSALKQLQTGIIREYGQVKKWSRECFLYISARKLSIYLNSRQIDFAANKLWESITDHNPFYPDSKEFLQKLLHKKIPFYLISASDCRLKFDDAGKTFLYDPEYSRKLKINRLDKFIKLGIPEENIFIGDPYDKPDPWVFRKALEKARTDIQSAAPYRSRKAGSGTGAKNPLVSIMVGDSVNNDLIPSRNARINKQILINRHGRKVDLEEHPEIKEITSFTELTF